MIDENYLMIIAAFGIAQASLALHSLIAIIVSFLPAAGRYSFSSLKNILGQLTDENIFQFEKESVG